MKRATGIGPLIVCTALALTMGGSGFAAMPGGRAANPLPQAGAAGPVPVIAWDAEGNALRDVAALVPEWDARAVRGTPFPVPVPRSLRAEVTLRRDNAWQGWLVVPRGWVLYQARTTGLPGPSRASFTSPAGAARGWLVVAHGDQYQGGAAFAADGLFPDGRAMIEPARPFQPRPAPANVALAPTPASLVRPTACTVKLTYRTGGLVVAGAAVIWPYRHPRPGARATYGAYLDEVFVALPPGHAALQDFITGAFLAQHDQRRGGCP